MTAERFLDLFGRCGGDARICGWRVALTGPSALVELGGIVAAEFGRRELVGALERRECAAAQEYHARRARAQIRAARRAQAPS